MKRIVSALILMPLTAWVVLSAPRLVFAVALCALTLLALNEYLGLADRLGAHVSRWLAWAVGGALVFAQWAGVPQLLEVLLAGAVLCGGASLFRESALEGIARGWMATLFGWLYVALPLSLLYDLRFGDYGQAGSSLVLFLLVPQWAQDTAAYYAGRAWGQAKIAPRFSPNKTVAGSIAGLLACAAAGAGFHYWLFDGTDLARVLMLSLLLGIAGQMSDIAESVLKRAAGVKDSSGLIPGHGGILDRIDGLLFAAPTLWLALRYGSL